MLPTAICGGSWKPSSCGVFVSVGLSGTRVLDKSTTLAGEETSPDKTLSSEGFRALFWLSSGSTAEHGSRESQ